MLMLHARHGLGGGVRLSKAAVLLLLVILTNLAVVATPAHDALLQWKASVSTNSDAGLICGTHSHSTGGGRPGLTHLVDRSGSTEGVPPHRRGR